MRGRGVKDKVGSGMMNLVLGDRRVGEIVRRIGILVCVNGGGGVKSVVGWGELRFVGLFVRMKGGVVVRVLKNGMEVKVRKVMDSGREMG